MLPLWNQAILSLSDLFFFLGVCCSVLPFTSNIECSLLLQPWGLNLFCNAVLSLPFRQSASSHPAALPSPYCGVRRTFPRFPASSLPAWCGMILVGSSWMASERSPPVARGFPGMSAASTSPGSSSLVREKTRCACETGMPLVATKSKSGKTVRWTYNLSLVTVFPFKL